MLQIDRSASARVDADPSRCMAVLAAVADYPSWSSLITAVEVVESGRVRLRAEVLGLPVEMTCAVELGGDRAVLRRVPNDAGDRERYEAAWTVIAAPPGSAVELHVTAELDAPGPARLLRGKVERRLADDLLADFQRALGT